MKRFIFILLNISIILVSITAEEGIIRRYALLVGANYGGNQRVVLNYAATDARALADVMQEMGGLNPADTVLLPDPSPRKLKETIGVLRDRIADSERQGKRVEFLFYYSGHSDEKGLLLGEELLSYPALKDEIQSVGADVNIAILDSCASGAFTRTKGGTRRAPFLFDESTEAAGHAFLTSSSADEAAQESDDVEGSFFTHYLITALRGAADTSQDRKVSLNEAYSYAAEETLARTEQTMAGPQHPSYEINLTGTGDLVLTDLRQSSELLSFDADISGRLFVRNSRGKLVLEMRKELGYPAAVALPPGQYTLALDDGLSLKSHAVRLYGGEAVRIALTDFFPVRRERNITRGGTEPLPISGSGGSSQAMDFNFINIREGGLEGIQLGMLGNILDGPLEGVQLSSIFNISAGWIQGPQISGVFNLAEGAVEGPQIAGVFNITEGPVEGLQLGGVFNMAEAGFEGIQLAGIFNMLEGSLTGTQIGGIFNMTAGDVQGLQAAGIFNMAQRVEGIQIGLVNIADEMNGVPIGLINIYGNGLHNPSLWWSNDQQINFGIQMGKVYYTFLSVGFPYEAPNRALSLGAGMGIELGLGPALLSLDLYAKSYAEGFGSAAQNLLKTFSDDPAVSLFPAVRLTAGPRFFKNTAFFVGTDLNIHIPGLTRKAEGLMTQDPLIWDITGRGNPVEIYPAWFAGFRL